MYLLEVRLGDSRAPEEGRSMNVFRVGRCTNGPQSHRHFVLEETEAQGQEVTWLHLSSEFCQNKDEETCLPVFSS